MTINCQTPAICYLCNDYIVNSKLLENEHILEGTEMQSYRCCCTLHTSAGCVLAGLYSDFSSPIGSALRSPIEQKLNNISNKITIDSNQ